MARNTGASIQMIPRIIPSVIACILLGAHFLRAGNIALTLVVALFPLILSFKSRWAWLAVQYMDYLGAMVWSVTALGIIQERVAMGRAWGVSAVILGSAAIFSVFAGVLLRSCGLKTGILEK